jgi:glucan-binding YG repeat protein
MINGWFNSGDSWYYLGEDGGMLSGQWVQDNQNYYYLTKDGTVAAYCYVKDSMIDMYYWVNSNGEYEKRWDTMKPNLDKYEVAI